MDNSCSAALPWSFTSWMSPAFARDNDAVTRALQISLSDDSSPSASLPSPDTVSPVTSFAVPDPSPSPSVYHRSQIPASAAGKITKRKPRVSKRTPTTTFIHADPASFRHMVQQVTGVRVGGGGAAAVADPVRPEPVRAAAQHGCLPTLDTSSAYFMDRAPAVGPAAVGAAGVAEFDFETFMSFPTLESWGVMQG